MSETFLQRGEDNMPSGHMDFEHMIKARAHKEGVRIGKTPKKLASICCLNTEKLKQIP
jgi:hypothetical protein